MSFKKFKGNGLFTGTELRNDNQVLITDEQGIVEAIIPTEDAGEGVQSFDGILCPGFINTHCHLELSHMKGAIAPGSGMVPFLMEVMGKRFSNKETIAQAMAAAEREMEQNGIVAVGDICNTGDTISLKKNSSLYYHHFVEVSGFVPATAATRLAAAQQVAEQFRTHFPPEQVSITPHAPYSVSPNLFQLINDLPGNNLLTMHNGESSDENLFFTTGEGAFLELFRKISVDLTFFNPPALTSLPAVCTVMNLAKKHWLLVHNCLTTAEDIQKSCVPGASVFFCLCPGANLYIGNPLPDVPMLQQQGIPICIGTDSLASNHQLSILSEISLLQQHFPQLSLAEVLQWATLNGAKALGIESRFGSFEKGKQPGVLLLEGAEEGRLTQNTTVSKIL